MSPPKTRSRSIEIEYGGGTLYEKSYDTFPPHLVVENTTNVDPSVMHGTQITVSEGHPFSHQRGRNIGDVGGDFFTTKTYLSGGILSGNLNHFVEKNGIQYTYRYSGSLLPVAPSEDMFPDYVDPASQSDSMDEHGAHAIALVKPTNSVADLATALGELFSEKLPRLPGVATWKERTRRARNAGDEYLNVQFGWLPLVGDIKDVAHGVSKHKSLIAQYVRDAGNLVRRRYEFPVQRFTERIDLGGNHTAILAADASDLYDPANRGSLILTKETVIREVFSGGFTYHLPGGLVRKDKVDESALYAKKILGLDLSPDTVWNLTPWSWAVDWFSNTGDVISNVSDYATDGLVLRYGYMQRHIVEKHTYTLEGSGLVQDIAVPPLSFVRETKIRRRANPFGFGVEWGGLTPRQIAITVALGIKRVL